MLHVNVDSQPRYRANALLRARGMVLRVGVRNNRGGGGEAVHREASADAPATGGA